MEMSQDALDNSGLILNTRPTSPLVSTITRYADNNSEAISESYSYKGLRIHKAGLGYTWNVWGIYLLQHQKKSNSRKVSIFSQDC